MLAKIETGSILELTPDLLWQHQIRLLLLDFDNTIIPYHVSEPSEAFLRWRETVEKAGVQLMIVSNSRKSRRVPDFCETWGLPYIKRAGKPGPGGIRRAMAQFDALPEETAMVGDQTFTDVLAGNLAGVTSILVKPIRFTNLFQRIRYGLEQPWILLGRRIRKR